jgi:hypothetical protein
MNDRDLFSDCAHVFTWRLTRCVLLLAVVTCVNPMPSRAQALPERPIQAFDGKVALGAEVIATGGNADEIAFFNYTDYEHNALRMFRIGVSGIYRPAAWVSFVSELRSEDLESPTVYAAYVRLRPWRDRSFDIQAGRIPPVFGSFGRRQYETGNPVIGYPLAYQYLTSLRTDAIPETADDVLRMRARGWRSSYPIGSPVPGPGIPLISGFQWDTGVEATWRTGILELAGAVTTGTLSSPRVSDDNGGKQLAARVGVTPAVGLILGASAAHGAWLSRTVSPDSSPAQESYGADAEYSRDHWIARWEMVWSRWGFPHALTPDHTTTLDSLGTWVEGRYRVTPRIFVAARADRLTFSTLHGATIGQAGLPWDAPIKRIEGAFGYYLQRNLVARTSIQGNWREGGRDRSRTYLSGQLVYWF